MTFILARGPNFENPLLWAVLVGWIISVIFHEFAHGIVAYWGGDYTIKERGGLTLNPIHYVDPIFSLAIPAVILLIGGVPLPGGSTYVRRDLLRSRFWDSAVSLAGPGMNLLLFLACAMPLHPAIGWADASVKNWTNPQIFLGAMAVLQMLAAIFNLVPVPPLDGFQTIAPYLSRDLQQKLSTPPISTFAFFAYIMVLWNSRVFGYFFLALYYFLKATGFDQTGFAVMNAYFVALFGRSAS